MTSSHTDLRALRRGPGPMKQVTSTSPPSSGAPILVPRPRSSCLTRLVVPAVVLLATGGILAYAARDALRPRLAVHVAAVIPKEDFTIAPAEAHSAPDDDQETLTDAPLGPIVVQAPGWIEPEPFAVSVPALAEGVVEEVLVLEGERVEVNQIVASLIDDDARLMLRAAEAAIEERISEVARATAALVTAESQVEVERIAANELRDEVIRKREVVAMGGVGAGEFRRMEIRLGGLEAQVATASKRVVEASAELNRAEAAKRSALVARDEAALRLSRMDVRSPVAGIVLARLVEPGSRISMSGKGGEAAATSGLMGAVLRVYDPTRLQVRVDVPLADAAKVGVGTRAVVSTEALPDQSFSGVVSRVVHEANIQRNTVQFKATIEHPSPVLKPEMLARVKLHGPATISHGHRSGGSDSFKASPGDAGGLVLLVPASAIAESGAGTGRVWVVDVSGGSPVARRRDVATSPAADPGFVLVTSGLRLTDRVILDPPQAPEIQEGTRLKVLGERTSASSAQSLDAQESR